MLCSNLLILPRMMQNYMTEASRKKGIAIYTRYIQLFALRCLAKRYETEGIRIDLCASDLPLHAPSALALRTDSGTYSSRKNSFWNTFTGSFHRP